MTRYYELTTGSVITSKELSIVYEIITGSKFPSDIAVDLFDDMVNLKGVNKEIKNPTPAVLVQMGQYGLAVQLCMELEHCDRNIAMAKVESIMKSFNINAPIEINLNDDENNVEDEAEDVTNTFENIIYGDTHNDNDFDADADIPSPETPTPKTAYEKFLQEYEAQNPRVFDNDYGKKNKSVDPAIVEARKERAISRDAERKARKEKREREKMERRRKLELQNSFLDDDEDEDDYENIN